MIVAKGMRRRRTMWESGWTPSETVGLGHGQHGPHGHHGRFGGEGHAVSGSFRLPPKIESMLAAWHTRAHQEADSTDPTAPEPELI